MSGENKNFYFQQLHIDVARNATDDFNLFHDPHNWHKINNNPFGGPIALGFQLESLVENLIRHHRCENDEQKLIRDKGLRFSNYQFNFANAVKPGEKVNVEIKKSQLKNIDGDSVLSNRVVVKTNDKLALMGYKKESTTALFLSEANFTALGNLKDRPDRSYLSENHFFLKRKFMNTSNAKNFLCGCFNDQSLYFDELHNIANFPEIFSCSLISCALLESALKRHHDFEKNPMVYTSHKITLDRILLGSLKSNDVLHMLVKELSGQPDSYEFYGLIHDNQILYRGIIALTSLEKIIKK
jgi:acyl dehydratase